MKFNLKIIKLNFKNYKKLIKKKKIFQKNFNKQYILLKVNLINQKKKMKIIKKKMEF